MHDGVKADLNLSDTDAETWRAAVDKLSRTQRAHLHQLYTFLNRTRCYNYTLDFSKSQLFVTEAIILGYNVSHDKIGIPRSK